MRTNLAHVQPLRPAAHPLRTPAENAAADAMERPCVLLRAAVEKVRAELERDGLAAREGDRLRVP